MANTVFVAVGTLGLLFFVGYIIAAVCAEAYDDLVSNRTYVAKGSKPIRIKRGSGT